MTTSRRTMFRSAAAASVAGLALTDIAVSGPNALAASTAGATSTALDWISVVAQGADPTGGKDSTSAIQGAIDALPATGGVVYLPAGTYLVSSTLTCTTVPAYFLGDGAWASVLKFTGTGDCVRIYDPTTYTGRTRWSGGFCGITIDGSNAGVTGPSTGLHIGDLLQYEVDLTVQNFSEAGSIGVHFDNAYYWTEQLHGRIYAQSCTAHVVFDCTDEQGTQSGSFDRCDLDVYIDQVEPEFDGVVLQNGAAIGNGSLRIRGNFASSTSSVSSAVLRLTGQTPANTAVKYQGASEILNSMLEIGVEIPTGTGTAQTVVFGATPALGKNVIGDCYGALNFGIDGYTNFSASNNNTNFGPFLGPVLSDSTLPGPWGVYESGFPSGWSGQVSCRKLPTGNEVMLSWALEIATGTVVTSGLSLMTLPTGFYYSANKVLPGNISGGPLSGNQYAPAYVSATGALEYKGPDFTSTGGESWWYGQGIYTLSVD